MTDRAPKTPAASPPQGGSRPPWGGPASAEAAPKTPAASLSRSRAQGGSRPPWDGPASAEAPKTPAALLTEAPTPGSALEDAFRTILQQQMQDMPMLNPALAVEAVGFRPWKDHWLGILITPWFMNLVLMPRVAAKWQRVPQGVSRHHVFPAGVFEFIGAHHPALGDYQACSLFSPMFDFASHGGARDTAMAALDALFDAANREAGEVMRAPDPQTAPGPALPRALSKRDLLFGFPPRAGREP